MLNLSECEKVAKIRDKSQVVGEFLDWLQIQNIYLCTEHEHGDGCMDEMGHQICELQDGELTYYCEETTEQLIAEFFDIDLKKFKEERLKILKNIRRESNV